MRPRFRNHLGTGRIVGKPEIVKSQRAILRMKKATFTVALP